LQARFEDIRLLIPILPQLVSLGFTQSYNGQVPYLLRAVLRDGLPQLKSLEIDQHIYGLDDLKLEGLLWYETLDGEFRTRRWRHQEWDFLTYEYMHSIARGAPNLEELGLHGMHMTSAQLVRARPRIRLDHS
jgi:hypothetical protein